jgi:hypothetical protein
MAITGQVCRQNMLTRAQSDSRKVMGDSQQVLINGEAN